jgi:hypothetical protein
MTTFDEREKAFEAQLVHDEDLKFRTTVRRNKHIGLWAAQKLGHSGDAAASYAAELVALELGSTGGDAIFGKVRADFDAAQVEISDQQIRREMLEFLAIATKEIMPQLQVVEAPGELRRRFKKMRLRR